MSDQRLRELCELLEVPAPKRLDLIRPHLDRLYEKAAELKAHNERLRVQNGIHHADLEAQGRLIDDYIKMNGELEAQLRAKEDVLHDVIVKEARLREGYAEAIADIEGWAAYASDYFKEKHDLEGELARHRAALAGESNDNN